MPTARSSRNNFAGLGLLLFIVSAALPVSGVITMLCKLILLALSYAAACLAIAFHRESIGLLPMDSAGSQLLSWVIYYGIVIVYCVIAASRNRYKVITFAVFFIIAIALRGFATKVARQCYIDNH